MANGDAAALAQRILNEGFASAKRPRQKGAMLKQKAVERAVAAAMQMTHGYRVLVVRPSGRTGWTINFSSSGRFRTINIQVDGDTTETDAQRLIEKKLDA